MAAPLAETVQNNQNLLNINMVNITKLTTTNFMTWNLQVTALLDGYDLVGHLDGSTPAPEETITVNDETTVNPAFTKWRRQDRLIYSALIGTLSPSIQAMVTNTKTSNDVWKSLSTTYATPTRGHIQQLRLQLKHYTKGDKTIDDYMRGLTTRFDQLALLGKPLDLEDKIEFIVDGLPEEYKTVTDQVEGREISPSIMEIHEKLINKEAKILATSTPSVNPVVPVTANMATTRSKPHQQRGNNSNWNNNNNNKPNQFQKQEYKPSKGYQGRCQICSVFGHSARRCPQMPQTSQLQYNNVSTSPFRPWQPRANLALSAPHPSTAWLTDSGATHHLTSDLHNMSLTQPYYGDDSVLIGDGSGLAITHSGSITLPSATRNLSLNNVLCVPNIKKNLISVYRLCNANQVSVKFFPASFQVKDLSSGAPLIQGKTKDELYEWPANPSTLQAFFTSPAPKNKLSDWHYRLGHPSASILKTIISKFSLPFTQSVSQTTLCSDCAINKTHKLPFHQSSILSSRPLQYIFTDLWSSPIISVDGFKYYLVLVDHYSRYTWLYPLKLKSQVKETFTAFKPLVENQFSTKIGTLYSDNSGKFIALRQLLTEAGISHLTSPPHTPEHNGVSERKHRHIVETGLTLLTHAHMPKTYWSYAFSTATYLINRQPTPVLHMDTPIHKLFGNHPNYNKTRVFGSLCFPWLRPYTSHKLEDRSTPCVFIGYSQTQSAYLCLQQNTGRIYVSRHVRFDEHVFPFKKTTPSPQSTQPPPTSSSYPTPLITTIPFTPHPPNPPQTTPQPSLMEQTGTSSSDSHSTEQVNSSNSLPSITNSDSVSADLIPGATSDASTTSSSQPPPAPAAAPPAPAAAPQPENNHPMVTRRKNQITRPNPRYNYSAALSSSAPAEPRTVAQALKDKQWRGSMSTEIDAFTRNGTFELVPRQPHQNVVGCRWLYTNKYHANGTHRCCKSRLVAKGYNQQFGRDYVQTFSPVIKATTLRLVLDIAVSNSWPIKQLDVNNAFLQGTLTDEVYMDQPPGYVDVDKPDHVWRLHKAVYGLKQAPRAWYVELRTFLLSLGFRNSLADTSLFILCSGNQSLYVLIYVDDILVTGNSTEGIKRFLGLIAERFSIKDPEDLNYFLGIEAHRSSSGLHLNQRKYILDLLQRYDMMNAKPVTSPMASSPKLHLRSGTTLSDATKYRRLIGSLQYLQFTRLDIAFAVNKLSQFMHMPTEDHWQAAKRILRYLAGTPTHGIFFSAHNNMVLRAYSDSDWAGDSDDYVSTNSYIIYLGKHPVSWSSRKQNGVARSSTEAEYRAVANATSEINWICSVLSELGISLPSAPVIFCDNVGATFLCANPVFHSRMKHIALDYHFVRNQVQHGVLSVAHIHTRDQLADALTKPLPRSRFVELRDKIGVVSPAPS